MKAKDLLALFNSFTPEGGAVLSVKVKLMLSCLYSVRKWRRTVPV